MSWSARESGDLGRYVFQSKNGILSRVDTAMNGSMLGRLSVFLDGGPLFVMPGLQVDKGFSPREPAVAAARPPSVARSRLSPTGSGSVSLLQSGIVDVYRRKPVGTDKVGATLRQTVGIDATAVSGAPGVWVFVISHHALGRRPIDWILKPAEPSPGAFRTSPGEFEYRFPETNLTLRGRLLHPGEGDFQWRDNQIVFPFSTGDPSTMTWTAPEVASGLTLEDPEAPSAYDSALEKKRKDLSSRIAGRIHAVTTSQRMGSPTLKTRVRQHAVILLTLAPSGEHPEPKPADPPDALFSLGNQTVFYHEFLVEFAVGMRDALSNLQWSDLP